MTANHFSLWEYQLVSTLTLLFSIRFLPWVPEEWVRCMRHALLVILSWKCILDSLLDPTLTTCCSL